MPDSDAKPRVAHFNDPNQVEDPEVYRFLYTYYFHQDRLLWSRTQALGVVEIAVLAAAFGHGGLIAIAAILFGSWLIWLIHRLILRDQEIRDQYLKAPEGNESILDSVHKPRCIRLTPPAANNWGRGGYLLNMVFFSILVANAGLILWFAKDSPPEDRGARQHDAIPTTVDQQARRLDELYRHYDASQKRMDALLDKWEEQMMRHDLILKRQEKPQ